MTTTVVHVDDPLGYDVYIGRAVPRRGLKASPYANPYKIGAPDPITGRPMSRERVVLLYEQWTRFSDDPSAVWIRENVHELCGVRLGCWCKKNGDPNIPCHGDPLAAMADGGKAL